MEAQVEYFKYTTALAVGLLLYLPTNFIPAATLYEFAALAFTWLVTLSSVLTGVLFYTRATTLAVTDKKLVGDAVIQRWAGLHLVTLVICFIGAAGFFVAHKIVVPQFFASPDPIACTASFTDAAGKPASLTYPCTPP